MARPQSGLDRRIVEKARARFLLEGVDGASLRQIAKDAETNIGMVYYYFPTKDDLFLAVVEDVYEAFLTSINEVLAHESAPDARIERMYLRVASMSEREFDVIRLIIREALVSSARLSKIAERFRAGHLPVVLGLIVEGLGDGTFKKDLHPVAVLASMMALGLTPQILRRLVVGAGLPVAALVPDAEATARVLKNVLMNGIGARAAQDETRAVSSPELAAPPARSTRPRLSGARSASSKTPGTTDTPASSKKSRK
jgi:AcrR family transcriptional regulator